MAEPRRIRRRSDQYLVPLPASVRRHMTLSDADTVWWHITTGREAVLSYRAVRVGGRPRTEGACASCDRLRTELERARQMLRTRTVADYNTAFGQGYERAFKDGPLWRTRLDGLAADVHDVRGLLAQLAVRLPERKRPLRRRGPERATRIEDDPPYADDFDGKGDLVPRPVERIPLPDLPPSSEAAGGDVASGGAAPPGHPQDSEARSERDREPHPGALDARPEAP